MSWCRSGDGDVSFIDTVHSQIASYKIGPKKKQTTEIQLLCNSTQTTQNQFEE